ncbi:MAG: DUF3168 domain-containing protein [Alphaproteobacteria bacterium]|nr:MAG: DUF3168 domain-containing protein [Alphaproteobacteria bacterium]
MSDGRWQVQQAIYSRLTAAGIAGGRIYDDVPENPTFPFVEIGEGDAQPADTDDSEGLDDVHTLHVWSRHGGSKEVREIMGAIHGEMHQSVLAATGRDARVIVSDMRDFPDPDGVTLHGVIRLRVIHYSI